MTSFVLNFKNRCNYLNKYVGKIERIFLFFLKKISHLKWNKIYQLLSVISIVFLHYTCTFIPVISPTGVSEPQLVLQDLCFDRKPRKFTS